MRTVPPRLRERLAKPFVIDAFLATLVVAFLVEGMFTVGKPFSWPIFGVLVLACYGAARLLNLLLPPPSPPFWHKDEDS